MTNLKRDFDILQTLYKSFGADLDKMFIAGGAIRDHFKGSTYSDIDIYAEEDYSKIVAAITNNFGTVTLESQSATSFTIKGISVPVQIIHKIEGKPEDVIEQFDFTINSHFLKLSEDFANLKRLNNDYSLRLCKRIKTPNNLLERLLKFTKVGYNIEQEQFIELLEQVKKANVHKKYLKDIDLTGFYVIKPKLTDLAEDTEW